MKNLILAALLSLPTAALAAPVAPAPQKPEAAQAARMQRMEQRLRTFRAIGLAETLDLDAAAALQLDAQMAQFDAQRRPLQEQLKNSRQILERAADGDPAASGQVDQAIDQAFRAHAQLEQIDRDMLAQVSQGMSPQQKAKLAVFLARFKHQMMMRFERARMGGMRGHPGFQGRGPGQP